MFVILAPMKSFSFISKIILITGLAIGLLLSCQKDDFVGNSSARLFYSTDTITFDTVFTTIGSVTHSFKIYNTHNQFIRIDKAYLEDGSSSNYRINIDGESGVSFENIDIPPNDSVYVFVEVTLDPNGGNLPMVVEDAIVINSNDNSDAIVLEAFGQDVILIKDLAKTTSSMTWTSEKPYLILEGLVVDTNHVLTIEEGVKVYFHSNATLYIWGNLQVNGTLDNPVVFEGDRFDRGFDRSAGRWGTIYFDPRSTGNSINYADIKNSSIGIWIGREGFVNDNPQLTLSNTRILNTVVAHILAFGAEIDAYNCVFADSRDYSLALFMGGKYNFYHCTSSVPGAFRVDAGLFESYERNKDGVALTMSNWWAYVQQDQNGNENLIVAQKALEEANFYNSIFWGNKPQEFKILDNGETDFNYYLDHCVLKQIEDSIDINNTDHFSNVDLNKYPNFMNDSASNGAYDFQLDTLSDAKDVGILEIINQNSFLEIDRAGNSRILDGKPDLGAYERIE